jgi:hypothetical protein
MALTLAQIREYARLKTKMVTNKPMKVNIVSKIKNSSVDSSGKPDTVMRSYRTVHYPYDKKKKPFIRFHSIEIRKDYYERYKNHPTELKAAISHEVAHVVVPHGHNEKFKAVAKKLGADKVHEKAYWHNSAPGDYDWGYDIINSTNLKHKEKDKKMLDLNEVKCNFWEI